VRESFDTALAEYSQWQSTQPRSQKTRNAYRSRVRQFLTFLSNSIVEWLTSDDERDEIESCLLDASKCDEWILKYFAWLQRTGHQLNTLRAHLNAISDFYKHRGLGSPNVDTFTDVGPVRSILSENQQQQFLLSVHRYCQMRDRLICMFFFYTGVLVSELVALNESDLSTAGDFIQVTIRSPLKLRQRVLTLHPEIVKGLRIYFESRRAQGIESGPLFMAGNGRISVRHVNQIVREIGTAVDLDITPRALRDACIQNLVSAGAHLDGIAYFAGVKLGSVRRYVSSDESRLVMPLADLPTLNWKFHRRQAISR